MASLCSLELRFHYTQRLSGREDRLPVLYAPLVESNSKAAPSSGELA